MCKSFSLQEGLDVEMYCFDSKAFVSELELGNIEHFRHLYVRHAYDRFQMSATRRICDSATVPFSDTLWCRVTAQRNAACRRALLNPTQD